MNDDRVKDFLVPDLGEGLADATVVSWHVAAGDEVGLNQPLCCLETAKAQVEIPSPYAGRVTECLGAEGDTLAVGSLLVRIDTQPDGANGTHARAPVLVGYGADDSFDTSRRSGRPRAAPAVRKLAADLHVDLDGLQPGSGGDGVITRDDVLAAAASGDVLPVQGIRARMAERMTLARRNIPDAHASVQVDGGGLLRLRDRLAAAGHEVSPFVLVLRLLTIALTHHPVLNSTWVDSANGPEVHTHRAVNVGFAVATGRGLLVPVVADARGLTTRQLAQRVSELIDGARNGTLTPAELQGSTFTVSNFGALGLDDGVPVINYPEAAILGMGALKDRAVVVDGTVTARPTMTLTCVFDHRVADGAQVAEFLRELRHLVETPETALLDL
ncbi:dihydrolipoamide acetyltransferase family protein [Mycobacterium sp.]|uniref:dihydrolipoamide acetyltransferase family protein n=1 Tax=Mycobacterium sp. TaxID=1785 RepID=UPI002C0E6EB7|nr:dihydrolipoamide acetyltransferase family protein [Mycobacterium sp.]HME47495.1 dihydrolipoamide acetyltransferase family protein [Mycobacterium sp.]